MTDCTQEPLAFPRCKGRRAEARFSGGAITSDGGALLLRSADRRLGLSAQVARALQDPRRQASCTHAVRAMVRQRLYGLALGYEDLNDQDALRADPALQTAVDQDRHAWAILALLVKRLRRVWPKVKITLRADSGFCRWRMLRWCEDHDVDYIVGIARKQRRFGEFAYAAKSWDRPRRVIVKAEHSARGANPRDVLTNLKGASRNLYARLYCARGDMENRIKEQQLDLFADRTSCHRWWPNQYRLLLSTLAYTLLHAIRVQALAGTELARACAGTIRLRLLKVGAVVLRNTRRIQWLLSSAYPRPDLFRLAAARLDPG